MSSQKLPAGFECKILKDFQSIAFAQIQAEVLHIMIRVLFALYIPFLSIYTEVTFTAL